MKSSDFYYRLQPGGRQAHLTPGQCRLNSIVSVTFFASLVLFSLWFCCLFGLGEALFLSFFFGVTQALAEDASTSDFLFDALRSLQFPLRLLLSVFFWLCRLLS